MARPAKKVDFETVAWVAEYLVSRVNRAGWKLRLDSEDKRFIGNGNPKAEVYRMAAQAIDLKSLPAFKQEDAWLKSLNHLIEQLNAWLDGYFDAKERTRMWTAYRVAKKRGDTITDELLFENYQFVIEGKQQSLSLEPELEQ